MTLTEIVSKDSDRTEIFNKENELVKVFDNATLKTLIDSLTHRILMIKGTKQKLTPSEAFALDILREHYEHHCQ